MSRYYILAYPKNVCSLIQQGRLATADKLHTEEKSQPIICYKNHVDCIAQTPTNLHQTFLVCIELEPPKLESKMFDIPYIEPKWIQCIYVYSQRGKNTLLNLLKNKVPIAVHISPLLYSSLEKEIKNKDDQALASLTSATLAVPPPVPNHVHIRSGNILTSKMQTLVNTVNCVGVMGKGIALGFKNAYPDMFEDYKKKCARGEVQLEKPYPFRIATNKIIINFPTKDHWRNDSTLKNIEQGLIYLATHFKTLGVTSLAIPPLGCTNGNLNWADVFPLIQKHLYPMSIPLEIYAPCPASQQKKSSLPQTLFFADAKKQENEGVTKGKQVLDSTIVAKGEEAKKEIKGGKRKIKENDTDEKLLIKKRRDARPLVSAVTLFSPLTLLNDPQFAVRLQTEEYAKTDGLSESQITSSSSSSLATHSSFPPENKSANLSSSSNLSSSPGLPPTAAAKIVSTNDSSFHYTSPPPISSPVPALATIGAKTGNKIIASTNLSSFHHTFPASLSAPRQIGATPPLATPSAPVDGSVSALGKK